MLIARELIAEVAEFGERLKTSTKRIADAVTASGTTVNAVAGIGPTCSATIVGYIGDIARFASKHHFATYNGTRSDRGIVG